MAFMCEVTQTSYCIRFSRATKKSDDRSSPTNEIYDWIGGITILVRRRHGTFVKFLLPHLQCSRQLRSSRPHNKEYIYNIVKNNSTFTTKIHTRQYQKGCMYVCKYVHLQNFSLPMICTFHSEHTDSDKTGPKVAMYCNLYGLMYLHGKNI